MACCPIYWPHMRGAEADVRSVASFWTNVASRHAVTVQRLDIRAPAVDIQLAPVGAQRCRQFADGKLRNLYNESRVLHFIKICSVRRRVRTRDSRSCGRTGTPGAFYSIAANHLFRDFA